MRDRETFWAPCGMGVEGLLAQELREMGLENVRAENGHVLFDGDEAALARASLNSRLAERVLILAGEFRAENFEELFQGVKALPWEAYVGKEDAFPVAGRCLSSRLRSVPDCQAIVKKAVVERLKERVGGGWFQETGPARRVRFLLLRDRASILIDTSGEGLHKRGYRAQSTEAPLKETLAAALCGLSRLRGDGLLMDPCCGSGTILIEGAMMAARIAPGLGRGFAAEAWEDSSPAAWRAERERAGDLARRGTGFRAAGSDIDPAAVALTLENARKAGVGELVSATVGDLRDFAPQGPRGWVICNPPYGERLGDLREAQELIRALGRGWERRPGWSWGVLSPEPEFEGLFGRRADKRRKLYNGRIECQYYQFFK